MQPLKIDLYTDIVCPFCLIGGQQLDTVLARDFPDVDVDIERHPVILMPDLPPQGADIVALITARYGRFDRVSMRERPEAEARAAGLELDLSRQPMLYPSVGGQTLIRLARARGDQQHRLATALARAYFLEARNIGDIEVLADVAAHHGFGRDEARELAFSPAERQATQEAATAAGSQGIRSVPHLVIGGAVSPGRDEATLATVIRSALGRRT